MRLRLLGLLLATAIAGGAQSRPAPVLEVFRAMAEALANRDAQAFLDQMDPRMPDFGTLRDEIRELVAVSKEIASTIDVVSDEGDDQKRTLDLDWLLKIDTDDPRRAVIHCQVEKQGKKWNVTALEPVAFFKR
jgi:hypothetical protein